MPASEACFVGDAFHQVAVAAERIGVVVDDLVSRLVVHRGQVFLGDGHADRHADALAERAGGHFDAVGLA